MRKEIDQEWQNFPLEEAKKYSFYSESSSSNGNLAKLLNVSFNHQNAARIAKSEKLTHGYFSLIDRIYNSEDTYYLLYALKLPLESKNEDVRTLGEQAFYHVIHSMGFSDSETAALVNDWQIGMGMGNKLTNVSEIILNGIKHHFFPIIELERYKRGAFHTLYQEFGIGNAKRYYGPFLKYQHAFRNRGSLPYFQEIMAASDHNASILDIEINSRLQDNVTRMNWNTLKPKATVRAIEVHNHSDLAARKAQLLRRYGGGKVTGYLLFGHSDGSTIEILENTYLREYELNFEDIVRLDVFGKKTGENDGHPDVVFQSCSTGVDLAQKVSKHFSAKVFAPLHPSYIKYIDVDKRSGKIERVKYSTPSVVYDKGELSKWDPT